MDREKSTYIETVTPTEGGISVLPSTFVADYMLVELNLAREDQAVLDSEQPVSRADYLDRSSLITREVRRDKKGRKRERISLSEQGKVASEHIGAVFDIGSVTTREQFEALTVQLGETYERLRSDFSSGDKALNSAQLTVARSILGDVRFKALQQYKAQEKVEKQAEARRLISVAVGHLGLADLSERNQVDSVSAYLSGYYKADKTPKRKSLVATARSIVYHEWGKQQETAQNPVVLLEVPATTGQQEVVVEPEIDSAFADEKANVLSALDVEPAEIPDVTFDEPATDEPETVIVTEPSEPAKSFRKIEAVATRLSAAAVVALAIVGGGYLGIRQAQKANASELDAIPSASVDMSEPLPLTRVESQEPQKKEVPITVDQSGPVQMKITYKVGDQVKTVPLGDKNGTVDYHYFSVQGILDQWKSASPERRRDLQKELEATLAQYNRERTTGMGADDVFTMNLGEGRTYTDGHSAYALNRMALGKLVTVYLDLLNAGLIDEKTGKVLTESPVVLEMSDQKGHRDYHKTSYFLKVPVGLVPNSTAYNNYVRRVLKSEGYNGIVSTCFIPEGKIVGKVQYYIAAVTVRIPAEEARQSIPTIGSKGQHLMTDSSFGARNLLKGRNNKGLSPFQIARQRAQIMAGRTLQHRPS